MIRLGTLMDVRDTSGPVVVMRYNLYSAAAITGDAAAGHQLRPGRRSGAEIADSELSIAFDGLRMDRSGIFCNSRPATRRCISSPWR